MSPWTALLESLHSALIDELIERHPEPKPELGMPQRMKELGLPSKDPLSALICESTFVKDDGSETRGFALLAVDADFESKLKLDSRKLWDALIKRAGREFMIRGVKPRLGDPKPLKSADLPAGFQPASRVIWIPFKLNPGACYLGVGA